MHYLPGCVKGCGGATVAIDVMDRCSTVANHRQPTPAACGPSPGTTTAEHRPARTCRSNRSAIAECHRRCAGIDNEASHAHGGRSGVDRQIGGLGQSVSVRVDLGGRRSIKKKKKKKND